MADHHGAANPAHDPNPAASVARVARKETREMTRDDVHDLMQLVRRQLRSEGIRCGDEWNAGANHAMNLLEDEARRLATSAPDDRARRPHRPRGP